MLRKLLMSTVVFVGATGVAMAADLPSRKAPPTYVPPPPPVFTWTGVYIGAQVGYQFGTSGTDAGPGILPMQYNANGVTGGAHVGYNYQMSQFVFGLEGDVNGLGYTGSNSSFAPALSTSTRQNIDGSIRGRLGVAWDRALVYATGGVAFADIHNSYNVAGFGTSFDSGRVGWTVGGGIEYAIDNNWSLRAEYRYTDYGSYTQFAATPAGGVAFHNHEYDNKVQVGFSYKFDMLNPVAPVLAKY
jgi:outer membrane immunogenic protein